MMCACWTIVAKTGDRNGSGRPHWPRFIQETPALLDLQDAPRISIGFAANHYCVKLEAAGPIGAKRP